MATSASFLLFGMYFLWLEFIDNVWFFGAHIVTACNPCSLKVLFLSSSRMNRKTVVLRVKHMRAAPYKHIKYCFLICKSRALDEFISFCTSPISLHKKDCKMRNIPIMVLKTRKL
jgi:hypothetical protein